jgi:ribosome-associated protein
MTAKKATRKTVASKAPRPAPKKSVAKKPAAAGAAKKPARAKPTPGLAAIVTDALDDLKAQNVVVLDVRNQSDVADTIVIASGTSDRHVKSLASRVRERAREAGFRCVGTEGEREGEWVLVDLQDVIVHVMLPRIREFYALEKLWTDRPG